MQEANKSECSGSVHTNKTFRIVMNLEPFTKYRFGLEALTKAGASEKSFCETTTFESGKTSLYNDLVISILLLL